MKKADQSLKRAIVVGASSGIGAALIHQLAVDGYQMAVLARRGERLHAICDEINRDFGAGRATPYVHDVTDFDTVPDLFDTIINDMGGLDLFVYNAGVSLPVGLKKFDFEKDKQTMNVNLIGALAWLNPVAAYFQEKRSGQIVGISSVAGERGRVGNPSYNASKAAMTNYLEGLRNRLSRHGVHVLTVKPGFVDTEMIKNSKRTFWVIAPERAAREISVAIKKRKQEVYTPIAWRWLMWVVRNLPSFMMRRVIF